MKHLKIIEAVFTKRLERGGKQQDLDCVLFMGSVSSAVWQGSDFQCILMVQKYLSHLF